jgi:hypothetical protein
LKVPRAEVARPEAYVGDARPVIPGSQCGDLACDGGPDGTDLELDDVERTLFEHAAIFVLPSPPASRKLTARLSCAS